MLTQEQADQLLSMLKESVSDKVFEWYQNQQQDEFLAAAEDGRLKFVLTLKRNPFEVKLHLRLKEKNWACAY